MNEGYIKISRSIMNNWVWQSKPFSRGQAWVDLIMLANYETCKKPHKGKILEFNRGVVHLSISALAERWGWGREKTRKFLDLLEQDEMIVLNATTNRTTITLVNYDNFQNSPTTNNTTNRTTNRQRTKQRADSESTTTNKYNKYNKDNEYKEEEEILPPGAVRLPDGSVDYENVPSNWDW